MPIITKFYPFLVVILLILFSITSAWSAIYKCEDDFGQVKFSDESCSRGESSSRINWLKSSYKKPVKKHSTKSQAKTSRNKIKTKDPVVLITLLTTTQLQLKTGSLTSSRGNESSDGIELVLPDGIRLDLTKVNTISIKKSTRNNEIIAYIVMEDGFESIQAIPKPYPVISADINIGRFSKSLEDIKTMYFFNSDKLPQPLPQQLSQPIPQKQKKDNAVSQSKQKSHLKSKTRSARQEVPVIELDLSDPEQSEFSARSVAEPKIKISAIPYRQNISDTDKAATNTAAKNTSKAENKKTVYRSKKYSQNAEVTLVNESRLSLRKNSMGSQRGTTAAPHKLLLSNNVQIPYKEIKQIKVRPTSDKSAIVVAVHLLSGEIKMENMSRPFTLISGRNGSQNFSRSLLEIKSVRFQ
jgi:hypothetical protein